jgi:hypothetical protein
MTAWLFQMTTQEIDDDAWSPNDYRLQVWEGEESKWLSHKNNNRDQGPIAPGDLIILYFCKSKTKDYGIYGWGVISKYNPKTNKITFMPTSPSDYLKVSPVKSDEIDALVDRIRLPTPHSGTMWAVTFDEMKTFRNAINNHIGIAQLKG